MLTLNTSYLLIALLLTGLAGFYLSLLVHFRYDGQFGWWFLLPLMVVFGLPMFFIVGAPTYIILISAFSMKKTVLLFLIMSIVYFLFGLRAGRFILSKRFANPKKEKAKKNKDFSSISSTVAK